MADRDDQLDRFIGEHPFVSGLVIFTLAIASVALAVWLIP